MGAALILLVTLLSVPRAVAASYPAVQCYEQARQLVSRPEAGRLCSRMDSTGPSECLKLALSSTVLSRTEALRLCECAPSSAPVRCFRDALENTFLGRDEALRLCLNAGAAEAPLLTRACRLQGTEPFG